MNEYELFQTVDGQFTLSFTYRFPELRGATSFFTFCYPWSYTESQDVLQELDRKFQDCRNLTSERYVNHSYNRNINKQGFKVTVIT